MRKGFVYLLTLLALCPGMGHSEPSPSPAPDLIGKNNPVHITAHKMVYEAARKLLHLDGDVHFDMKDTKVETATAEFNTETQVGQMSGGVKITQPGSTVNADKMLIFYLKRRAVLTGGVKLVTTASKPGAPPPVASGTPVVPTTMTCREMEYLWEQHQGNAIGDVHVEQADKKATADSAHYDEIAGKVTLTGHVLFSEAGGSWMRAPVAYLNLKDQTFEAEGVSVLLYPNQSAGPRPSSPKPATGTGPERVIVPPLAPQLQPVLPQDVPPELRQTPSPASPSPAPSPAK